MEHPVSHFAQNINLPICNFMDQMQTWPRNQQKEPISFLSGDPTIYGMNSFRMPERGYEIVRQNIMNENNHGYSASIGTPAFREAVTKLYSSKFPITAADVQINHGVNMGLLAVLMAFTNEGDEVLVPEIGYPFYQDLCPAMKRKAVPYKLKKNCNFEIDLQHAASLINERTSFMYVINPTNPMGTVFTRAHIQQILSFSNEHQVPLVVDEVYFKMVFPGVQALSFGQVTEEVPVVVLSGVQKILSVPGWVQSWTVFFDKNNILKQIKYNLQVVATIFLHTNTFIQHSMPAILKQVGLFTNNQMPAIFQNYQYLSQRINKVKGLRAIPAQGTIYLGVQIDFSVLKNIDNDTEFVKLLRKEENVNILPLSVMGKSLQGLRLLTCAKEQFYDQFICRLQAFISRHTKE